MVMEKIALDIGVGLVSGLGQDGTKLAAKRLLEHNVDSKDPVLYFGLWVNFRDNNPPQDDIRLVLNESLGEFSRNGNGKHLTHNNNIFDFDVTWKTLEGCEFPAEQPSWDSDALVDEETDMLDELPSECVIGFAIWLWPRSLSDRKELIMSAYHILKVINCKLQENSSTPKMKSSIFSFVRANNQLSLQIHNRLTKRVNGNKETKGFIGTIDIAPLSNDIVLLTIPLREIVVAEALADSFSFWGAIKK
jgi:hypothetical protein